MGMICMIACISNPSKEKISICMKKIVTKVNELLERKIQKLENQKKLLWKSLPKELKKK